MILWKVLLQRQKNCKLFHILYRLFIYNFMVLILWLLFSFIFYYRRSGNQMAISHLSHLNFIDHVFVSKISYLDSNHSKRRSNIMSSLINQVHQNLSRLSSREFEEIQISVLPHKRSTEQSNTTRNHIPASSHFIKYQIQFTHPRSRMKSNMRLRHPLCSREGWNKFPPPADYYY